MMQQTITAILLLVAATSAVAAEELSVQRFLNSGELSRGELALSADLDAHPDDDQVRFSLGVLRLVRSIERLGQGLYEYGAQPSNQLFVRLPVPKNDDPASINWYRFRRLLDDFSRDLSVVDSTLAKISKDDVRLPLKLAEIHVDLDSDGKPTDQFLDILLKIFQRRQFDFLADNPDFLVVFDRGDVAWLRAYCHLLMAIIDGTLSCADEPYFDLWADQVFAKPKHSFEGTLEERWEKSRKMAQTTWLKEPARLHRLRVHLIQVVDLNHEAWKFIRLETDDDHEWLPGANQHSVLGLPVRTEMIDQWLRMMSELKLLLEGERLLPKLFRREPAGKGFNLKLFLDNPPETQDINEPIPDEYYAEGKEVDLMAFGILVQMILDPSLVGYPIWFN